MVTISYSASGINDKAYAFQTYPVVMIFKYDEISDGITFLRKNIKEHFVNFLNMNYGCTKEYRYYICIALYDEKMINIRFKNFVIDPKKLR